MVAGWMGLVGVAAGEMKNNNKATFSLKWVLAGALAELGNNVGVLYSNEADQIWNPSSKH